MKLLDRPFFRTRPRLGQAPYTQKINSGLILAAGFWCAVAFSQDFQLDRARIVNFERDKPIEVFLHDIRNEFALPGLAVAVVDEDGVRKMAAVGVTSISNGNALSTKSRFHVGSVAKSITSLLVASLVQDGIFSFETTIAGVFPEWESIVDGRYGGISLAELLSHSSGVIPYRSDDDVFGANKFVPNNTRSIREQRKKFAQWALRQEAYKWARCFWLLQCGVRDRGEHDGRGNR